jgi:DNA-binding SARP family transcriptional activator
MDAGINKINRPLPREIVPRERLFHLLDEARTRPVVWVSAPGGSGKSSLVTSYLDSRGLPCLWYQVDRGDRDVATLFHYLATALDNAGFSRKATPLPLLTPEQYPAIETFSRRFFERLFAALPPPCVLVFDDCHEVPDDSLFHLALRGGLYEIPPGMNVIVVGRNAPPPLLVHLRSQSRVKSIEWDDIRLTPDETERIALLRTSGLITGEEARLLHERTQGWAAGVVLILEGGSSGDPSPMSGTQPVKEVFDYFAGELFAGMDERTRSFLLKTAFFAEISPLAAERLTHVPDAGRILSGLYEKNCFTEQRYETEPRYRYHPLFREFLLERACRLFSTKEIRRIRHDAAVVLEESNRHEEAVELFIAAGSWEEAGRLIVAVAPLCLAQGRAATVLRWLERLPEEIREAMPYLLFWRGACGLCLEPARSFDDFRRAYHLFGRQGDRVGMCLSWAAGADASLYNDFVYQEWIPVIEEYMRLNAGFPTPRVEARVVASMFNAMSLQQPDHPRIREMEQRAYDCFRQPDALDFNVRLATGVYLAVFNLWSGEIGRAGFIIERLDLLSRSAPVSDLTIFTIRTTQALVDFFTASFSTCRQRVFEALQVAEEAGIRTLYLHVMGHGIVAALSDGDQDTVDILLARMKDNLDRAADMDLAYYYFALSWRSRLKGDLDGAFRTMAIAAPLLTNVNNLPSHAIAHIALAELHCRRGDGDAALEQLLLARRFGERLQSQVVEFMCLLLEADIALEQGREGKGTACLAAALSLGRRQGIVNMYWWQPDTMARLCMRALKEGIETGYVSSLIRRRGLMPKNPPIAMEEWPWPVRVYALGRFELHINGVPVRPRGKARKKPLEMLQTLLALGGGESREGQVADLLWPEAEGDTARKSVKSTLHRLRELLGNERAVLLREGRLLLDPSQVWSDARAFEELLAEAQARGDAGEEADAFRLTERAFALYRGHFLDHERDKPCVSVLRRRLRGKFRSAIVAQGKMWRGRGNPDRALECYLRGVEVDDLAEELYRNLMECYLSAGLRGEMLTTFQRCRDALALHGLSPSPETMVVYRQVFL